VSDWASRRRSSLRAPRLRVIGRPGIGVDNIDLAAATARSLCVVNTPDAPTQPVVEKVIGWMIMLAHRLRNADRVLDQCGARASHRRDRIAPSAARGLDRRRWMCFQPNHHQPIISCCKWIT